MILKALQLNNIRSYVDQTLEFPECGITLLAGDIGSGKSTVLLSIEFALFGLRGQEVPGSSLLRHGANAGSVLLKFAVNGKDVEVKRVLERKGKTITQTSGYIAIDGVKEELTTLSLKSQVLDLIGYPERILKKSKSLLYRYTVYTPQEQMKEILFAAPDERMNIIRDIFSVDKYKRIAENAKVGTRELRTKVRELQATIADVENRRKELATLQEERQKMLVEKEKIKTQLGEQEQKYQQAASKTQQLKEKIEHITKLEHEKSLVEAKVDANNKTSQELSRDLDKLYARLKGLEGSMTNADAQIRKMQQDIVHAQEEQQRILVGKQRLQSELQRYQEMQKKLAEFSALLMAREEQINILHREIKQDDANITSVQSDGNPEARLESMKKQLLILPKLKETKEVLGKQMVQIEQDLALIEGKITESNDKIKNLLKLDECPTCLQKVPKNYRERIEFNETERVKKLGDMHKKQQYALNEAKAQLGIVTKDLESSLEKEKEALVLQTAMQQIVQMRAAVEEKRARKGAMEKQLALLTRQRDSLKTETDASESVSKRAQEQDERLQVLNIQLVSSTRQLAELLKDREEFERMTKEQLEKFKRVEEMRRETEVLTKKREFILAQIELMKDVYAACKEAESAKELALKTLQLTKEELAKREQTEQHLQSLFAKAEQEISSKEKTRQQIFTLQQTEQWIESRFIPVVELIERHILAKILGDFNDLFQHWFGMLIDDQSLSARVDSRFTPIVEQNGYETSFENLSGGEKTSLSLAYRLALNKTINSLSEIIKTKDLLVLDEPTDGFSGEQLHKLREVLEDLKLRQILLVSHEDAVEGFADQTIRFRKDGHISKIISTGM